MFSVYFNKRNQLLRAIKRPKKKIIFKWFQNGTKYVFSIIEVEVLRARQNSVMPCNASLTDEDAYTLAIMIHKTYADLYLSIYKKQ